MSTGSEAKSDSRHERWFAALWPTVRSSIPPPPARVVDIGCGPDGGFVPMLRAAGYDAIGIDPTAPDEPPYQRVEFERADLSQRFDAAVASTSLHHVLDPADVIDRLLAALTAAGAVVVIEWAWEKFDEATAGWAFERLGDGENWLSRRREGWLASGKRWPDYLREWTTEHGLHRSDAIVRLLDERLQRRKLSEGPYLFPALAGGTEADERAAIDAGEIRATRLDYIATVS
jgi:SAM-dependent methyltransferase